MQLFRLKTRRSREGRVPAALRRPLRRALSLCAVVFLAGCSCFPEWETVRVLLPPLPSVWIDCGLAPDWEMRAFWLDGEACASVPPEGSATLCLPRGESVAILAFPLVAGIRLRPAGAVFAGTPFPADEIPCTWEAGYAASAARVLIRAGVDPACFDLKRFVSEAFARLGDPWKVPPELFVSRFAERSFSVTLLNPPKTQMATVSGLPGPAASDSPFGPVLVPYGDGNAVAELCNGVSRWFAAWGRVSVQVLEDGSAVWVLVRRGDPPSAPGL